MHTFMKSPRATLIAAGILALPLTSHGSGGHFAVDDAELTDAGRCQIETWYARSDRNNDEITFLPACNPTGNLEITLGISRIQEAQQRDTLTELALKTQILPLASDRMDVALSVAGFRSHNGSEFIGSEAVLPVTVQLSERLMTHVNLGWAWERGEDDAALMGLAFDYALHEQLSVIAEGYGSHRGDSRYGAGLRFTPVDGLDVDLAVDAGRRDHRDNAVIAGLAIAF